MNDRARAIALELAEKQLVKLGWKFSASDIGETAAEIINAMNAKIIIPDTSEDDDV